MKNTITPTEAVAYLTNYFRTPCSEVEAIVRAIWTIYELPYEIPFEDFAHTYNKYIIIGTL